MEFAELRAMILARVPAEWDTFVRVQTHDHRDARGERYCRVEWDVSVVYRPGRDHRQLRVAAATAPEVWERFQREILSEVTTEACPA